MDNNLGKVGLLIGVAIMIIVGVIFLQTSAQAVGTVTDTVTVENTSLATVVNDTAQYLTDYKSLASVVIYNETNDAIVGAGNYTVTNNVIYNGAEAVRIVPDTTADYKSAWVVSGTAQPLTYVKDAGSRAMANLISIMFALALLTIALYPVIKDGFGGMN